MKLFSEKGLALELFDNKVFVRFYPRTDILVETSQETALYLYHLILKYNQTITTPKWSSFWRRVSQIERTILVMFINSNTYHGWGKKFNFVNEQDLPKQFLEAQNKKRMPTSTLEIRTELEEIFKVYVKSTVTLEDIQNYWEKNYPHTCEVMKKHSQFDNLVKVAFEKDKIEKIMDSVLQKEGYNSFEKPFWADNYTKDVFDFLVANEIALFGSTAFQLASYTIEQE